MNQRTLRFLGILALAIAAAAPAGAQTKPSATGTLNVVLENGNGIQMVLNSDASGVTLGGTGTSSATLAFGNISAYGAAPANVTITNQTSTFTATTYFDVDVQESGLTDANNGYTLSADVTSLISGVTLQIDGTTLTTTSQNLSGAGTYATNVQHSISAVVPTSGGPTPGTQLTATINLVATSN